MSATGNRLIKVSLSPRGNGHYLFPPFSLYFPFLRLPFPLFFPFSFFFLLFTPFVSLAVSRDIYTLALFNWRGRHSFARDHCQLRIGTHAVCQMAFIRDKINIYSVSSPPPSLASPFLILFLALFFPASLSFPLYFSASRVYPPYFYLVFFISSCICLSFFEFTN